MKPSYHAKVIENTPSTRKVVLPNTWPVGTKVTIVVDEMPAPEHWVTFDDEEGNKVYVVKRREMDGRADLNEWEMALTVAGWTDMSTINPPVARAMDKLVMVRRKP